MKKQILFAAGFFFLCSFARGSDDDAYKKGVAAYIAGNSDEAMLQLYKAHTANPDDNKTKLLLAEVYIDQASKAMAAGDYVAASKYVHEADKLKVMDDKVIRLRESLKTLSEKTPEKPPVEKIIQEKPPTPVKKTVQKTVATPWAGFSSGKAPQKAASEPIIIRERIIERVSPPSNWKKPAALGIIFLAFVTAIALIFFKLYLNERAKESVFLEEKLASEKRIQKELDALKDSAAHVKAELAEEKKKTALAASHDRKNSEKNKKDEKIDIFFKKMEDSLDSVRSQRDRAREAEKPAFTTKTSSIPLTDFLPEYTDIPLDASSLSEMLGRASGNSARLNLLWALGNKTELKAVETLKEHLDKAKGEEYREILKSLKKIALRPETAQTVKTAVENIFSAQRRKGIII
ncbi:MAG: hypothetical protein CVU78_04690 [Elusimicrobia bacterium HGW-Elusimicrobia-2]|nr:MAG: hypothetical protein CVU78_04690 [Elusimicrobia bacterium HGW-Elusimicrobia-2]